MFLLGFIPEGIHLGKGHILKLASLLFGALLHIIEASYKFSVGFLKCIVGAYAIKAGGIDQGKK